MPHSIRGPIVPRQPLSAAPRIASIGTALNLSRDTMLQIASIWQADLLTLRGELLQEIRHELRPWYVRLWEWMHGR